MAHRRTTSPPGARKMKGSGLRATDFSRAQLAQNLERLPDRKVTQTVNGVTTQVARYA